MFERSIEGLGSQAGAVLQRSKTTPAHPPHAFAAADERDARNRIRLANELQSAVPNQELLFHYQPQFDLSSEKLVGAEALLLWNHGVFGLQAPGRFIGIAEETGAILEIGAWGPRTLASHAAQVNRGRSAPIRFALNVSVLEFTQRDIVAFVQQVLEETACHPEWLTLELTENVMVGEPGIIRHAFEDLRRLGIGISIDDFGTGYSNLRYLESFPLSEIKVDRSFVHDVAHSAAKRIIVESVIKLGAALDIRDAALRHAQDLHHRSVTRRIAPDEHPLPRVESLAAKVADRHIFVVVVQTKAIEVDALSPQVG